MYHGLEMEVRGALKTKIKKHIRHKLQNPTLNVGYCDLQSVNIRFFWGVMIRGIETSLFIVDRWRWCRFPNLVN